MNGMKTVFSNTTFLKTSFTPANIGSSSILSPVLASVSLSLNNYLSQFKNSRTPITIDQATTLAGLLNRIDIPLGSNAENVRQVLLTTIETLLAAIITYTQYQSNLQTVAAIASKASILDNLQNLIDYVNLLQSSPFPTSMITVAAAQIKPEYVRYIELYGKPLNGAFDPSLLAAILAE